MRIKPSKGYVLLKPVPKQTETNGFILTDQTAEAPQIAEVVSVGDDIFYDIGQKLIYRSYTTTDMKIDGIIHYLVHNEDILGKVIDD